VYDEPMKTTMPIINNGFSRLRKRGSALVKALNRLIRNLRKRAGADAEQWIEEFERLSGSGHSGGWRFDRNEVHHRRY